jgi:feruloyl-CoA synthase
MDGFRDVALGPLTAELEQRSDGSMVVRSTQSLSTGSGRLTDRLEHWADAAPDRVFLAQRTREGGWRSITYGDAEPLTRRIAAALLERGLTAERPLAVLSGNDIEQGLLMLAAMRVGVPFAPVSPAYSLISSDYGKVKAIIARLTPGMVFASDASTFAKAIAAACPPGVEIVTAAGAAGDRPSTQFDALAATAETPAVAAAMKAVGPDTVAKILFTSGSTGEPKGVINTHRMLSANQAMLAHWLAFATDEPPVLVDWLPWHHTFGGNHNFGFVLNNGGSLYIDHGKPLPSGIAETARNLREIAPTLYFNVPKGYEELTLRLKDDDALRRNFFSRLKLTFYAGAGLPPHVAAEMDRLAVETTGKRILMVSSLGSTETAPAALACTKETARPGVVGVPLPGLSLKLVPNAGKLEARLRGPTMTPGYWREPEHNAKAFDDEGYYCLGDALRFATPGDPNGGFIFDGRVSEDFKLGTGTWVSVGPLRARLVAAFAPLARDVVIAGHDRDDVTALVFPDMEACRALAGATPADGDADVIANARVRGAFADKLAILLRESTGSSNRVARIILLAAPPSIDGNEITDKGSINQRAVLGRRAAAVDALYARDGQPDIILPAKAKA